MTLRNHLKKECPSILHKLIIDQVAILSKKFKKIKKGKCHSGNIGSYLKFHYVFSSKGVFLKAVFFPMCAS